MKKKLFIALLVVILVGYASYCIVAQNEFSQGQADLKAKDWLSASIHFERVQGYMFAIPSHSSEIQQLIDQSSLLVFGQSMREKGNYKEALQAYETFIYKFPNAGNVSLVKEYFPAVYLDWGNSFLEKSDFTGAIEKFDVIAEKYAQSSIIESAKEAEVKTFQTWGDELYKVKNYEAAIEKYEIVLTNFSSQSTELAREAEAKTYQTWGDDLYKAKDYQAAVDKYNIVLTNFSSQSAAYFVKKTQDELYMQWADQLRGNKQPDLALEKYEFVITNFKGSSSSTKAEAELIPTKLEYAMTLHQNEIYVKEIEILRGLIKDHKETPEAQQASQKIIPAYNSYGRQQIENNHFIKSMEVFTDAKEFALDKDTQTLLDTGYKDATQGLAKDTGTDGLKVIDEAYLTACNGHPVKSPVVGIQKGGPGKGKICNPYLTIPIELQPTFPAEFKYVIDVEDSVADIQSCSYTVPGNSNSFKLVRQKNVTKLTVRNILTGNRVTFANFYGSAPESCPEIRTFSSFYETVVGDAVNIDQISPWLKQVLR